jgi:hypothetical protein
MVNNDSDDLTAPRPIAEACMAEAIRQDQERGDWPSPRNADQPFPPWPQRDSPVLRYLLYKARAQLDAGADVDSVLLDLAVHAWFEGGIENYDRGQRDARGQQ